MRKAIAVSAVLTLLLSLVLTGCSQDASSDAGINSSDSSIINEAGISSGSTGDIVSSAGDSAETQNNEQSVTTDQNGSYTWQVGDQTITTKINVMDYIDGNVWHVNDMASALGWDKNKRSTVSRPMTFQPDDTYDIYINFSSSPDNSSCLFIFIKGNNRKPVSLLLSERAPEDYTFNDNDYTMPFEGIVLFAYACEFLSENPTGNPFEGVLNKTGDNYCY